MPSSDKFIKTLDTSLYQELNISPKWTIQQHNIFKIIKRYYNNYKSKDAKYETNDDRAIITNNLLSQYWYKLCNIKQYLSILFDSMTLKEHSYCNNAHCVNLTLVLHFASTNFTLNAVYHRNKINNCINYYIYFENGSEGGAGKKAYLCLYTSLFNQQAPKEVTSIKVPEFPKIYEILETSEDTFKQFDMVCFFSEIVFFYDESGEIANTPFSYGSSENLNTLIRVYSEYLLKKFG